MNWQCIHRRSSVASFTGAGLLGYAFGSLRQNADIYYIEVDKGHDTFMISKRITRTYYVLSGCGSFTIEKHTSNVEPGMLIEVPPGVEFTYSGSMTLIAFSTPRWFRGNDRFTRWNPAVVQHDSLPVPDELSWLKRSIRWRMLGKSPVSAYLKVNRWVWRRLPTYITDTKAMQGYGRLLHVLSRNLDVRAQVFSTFFLRNRPQLELLRRLAQSHPEEAPLRVAVLGCSTGAEAYSIAWTIRSARPYAELAVNAVDISRYAVDVAEEGAYSLVTAELTWTNITERMTTEELESLFDRKGNVIRVKPWAREGITWSVGDVAEPGMVRALGPHDIVVANNFLCHMDPVAAEKCLGNIASLTKPGGYLFVAGIDLEVRSKVARKLAWIPVQELLEEIHEGDSCMRDQWPFQYGSLEPLNKKRQDWRLRYASVFQIPQPNDGRHPGVTEPSESTVAA